MFQQCMDNIFQHRHTMSFTHSWTKYKYKKLILSSKYKYANGHQGTSCMTSRIIHQGFQFFYELHVIHGAYLVHPFMFCVPLGQVSSFFLACSRHLFERIHYPWSRWGLWTNQEYTQYPKKVSPYPWCYLGFSFSI
jgi:hypothetical protein